MRKAKILAKGKQVLFFYVILTMFVSFLRAQEALPYYNNFEDPFSINGWKHYAISGNDDWVLATPSKEFLSSANSGSYAWVTKSSGSFSLDSEMALETPGFDLTNAGKYTALSFYHKRHTSFPSTKFLVEYSTDNGQNWLFLDNIFQLKKNWQQSTGFQPDFLDFYDYSTIDIGFLSSFSNVKFRFRFKTSSFGGEGWAIDDFKIGEKYYNVAAVRSDTIFISEGCNKIYISTPVIFDNQYNESIANITRFYLSQDKVLDQNDLYLSKFESTIQGSILIRDKELNFSVPLSKGQYYIIYEHDSFNVLKENNENDNISYAVLSVEPLYSIPVIEDFESSNVKWRVEMRLSDDKLFWQLGRGYRHHIEDTHSGVNAWHTSKSIEQEENDPKCLGTCYTQYLLSPYVNLNLNATNAKVLNFWYKMSKNCDAVVEYKSNCQKDWMLLRNLSINRNDDWDYMNILVSSLANSTSVQFRISYNSSSTPVEGLIIDDFYVGDAKADLTVEGNKKDLFTSSDVNIETLRCLVVNSGLTKAKRSLMKFYWSDNEVFDSGDVFLGQKELPEISDTSSAWVDFIYTKPSSLEGTYYVFYQLDTDNAIDEMRENNNTGYFIINQIKLTPIPYYNDFEDQIIGWRHNASLGQDDWQWTTPKGRVLQSAFSGVKGWITKDTGLVSPMSRMHLYTPVFDLSTAKKPVIEFDMKLDSHGAQYAFEGKMNMSYSVDGGTNWIVLDTTSQSYNRWYYPMAFIDGLDKNYYTYIHTELLSDRTEKAFVPFDTYNGRDVVREYRYNLDISFLAGATFVQFRFNLATLKNTKNSINKAVEGAFIDNFSIQESTIDLNVDYKKALMISSKSDGIKFYMNVKNKGNFISNKTNVRFYVSRDTILSSGDPLLGLESIPEIQPDKYHYLNVEFGVPINFSTYKYLLYELDKQNANIEENESNNISYWPLALDSIKTYPYFNNFNDSIINGWHQYSVSEEERFKRNLCFRHILAPNENIYQRRIKSGEWFTEPYELHFSNAAPYFFLESPAFDFTKVDSIFLSFKLLCTGSREDGGNMQYSLNGGSTWQVLNKTTGLSHNWYNSWLPLLYLDNEPGWNFDAPLPSDTEILDSTSCGVTFLKGKKDVVFRFKHKSSLTMHGSGTVQGMRVDDFKVEAFGVDLIANNQFTPISAKLSNPFIDSYYSFSCKGNTTGRPSVTKVYWSKDSILESSDKLLSVFNEDALAPGNTARHPIFMTLPTPVTQLVYYLLYKVDTGNNLIETDESNNIGSFRVEFDAVTNSNDIGSASLNAYISNDDLYVFRGLTNIQDKFNLNIFNPVGQLVHTSQVILNYGLNKFLLPPGFSPGNYVVVLQNEVSLVSLKYLKN